MQAITACCSTMFLNRPFWDRLLSYGATCGLLREDLFKSILWGSLALRCSLSRNGIDDGFADIFGVVCDSLDVPENEGT